MARINNYIKDDIVEPTDIVIGTEQSTGKTKNYSIDSIRNFFVAKTNVDNIIFKMGNHLVSGEFTANSNYFSGLTEFKFNMIDSKGDSITPIFSALKISLPTNGFVIKVEDSAKQNKFILAKILNIIDGGTFFTITLDAIKNVGAGELVIGNNFSLEVGLYTDTTSGVEWSNLLNKPTTFTPSAHTHIISDTIGLQAALDERFVSAEEKAAITHINRPALDLVSGINTGDQDLSGYELLSNKVISLSGASTNAQYPSAKLTFDQLALKEDVFSKNTAFNKNYSTLATDIKVNGVQSLGVLDTLPRADHIHPIDTSREPANANIQSHISSTLNPHAVTKTQVGLGNVDNTTDLLKPISTATQDALNLKENVANKQNSLATDGTGTKYPTVDAIKATNIPAESLNGSTFKTVQHIQDLFHSAGWTSGGVITNAGGGVITVSEGTGLIRATNSDIATIFFTDFAASIPANVVLVDGSQNYIYVEYNAGAPRVIATTIQRADYNTNFLIGAVYRVGTTLHINSTVKTAISDHAGKMIAFNKEVMPYARANGSMISEVATRGFAITAGTFWNGLVRFTTNAFSTATGSFFYFYRNGVGGWTKVPTQTQINNTQYDNGTGTLATLSNNKYGIHWVFIDTDGDTYVVYGQGDYTLIEAQNEMIPASLPVEITSHGFVVGKIIIQKSLTTFAQIESAFAMGFSSAMASEHNSLAGLQGGAAGDYQHLTATQATIATQEATNTLSGYVSAGTQTFGGVKTFTLSPIVPTPTTDTQVANKIYVDGKVADTITDGVTTIAPSQNAVFDALVLKEPANANIQAHISSTSNPHGVTKAQVGLGNVDNVQQIPLSQKGAINGVAELDAQGFVKNTQLPSYVDDVIEGTLATFPATGETGKIYVDTVTNKTYRWSGTVYTVISETIALGETDSTAYRGDRGKIAYDHSQLTHDKTFVGLGNVDNTSDINKPVSTATQTALDLKVDKNANIVAGTKTKITYDVKGLVTAGADATTDDIIETATRVFLSPTEKTAITHSNRSALDAVTSANGANTGDNAVNSNYSGLVSNATHTGDVTGATALTITNDAVTNAKLANMAVNTIKGRITAGTGDPEDLTATQVRTIINVADGANNYVHPANHPPSIITQDASNRFVTDTEKATWNDKPATTNLKDLAYGYSVVDNHARRVLADLGTIEPNEAAYDIGVMRGTDTLKSAKILMLPINSKENKLHSVLPTDGTGDFTVTRASTATRINSLGLLETVPANVPIIDHSNGCPELVVEPQVTNLLKGSKEFNNSAYWSGSGSAIDNIVIAPTGLLEGSQLTVTGAFYQYASVNVLSGEKYTFSIYLKASSTNKIKLGLERIVGTGYEGVISQEFILNNEWQRFEISHTFIYDHTLLGTNIFQSTDPTTIIYAYGAQLQKGNATSFIPTTTGTVTKVADVETVTPPIGTTSIITTTNGVDTTITYTSGVWQIPNGRYSKISMI